ncbi:class I SAM-dependent DNA methyltransferase [Neisseria wadsworthii]|uniref:class I SAM-dependent DNA methyltransferase n=1 Tax=Neisseria wadsworthii TaxID=607711 RepID=UPI000D30315F|nr:DNA methyltransferase [Neisseria wadsworthii]
MNAIEIEEAVSDLFSQPFDAGEFSFAFLEAFGNKSTTIKRLRSGETNQSDAGGVLQRRNIHLAVASVGNTADKLAELKNSPATAKAKAQFILATDGEQVEAEDLASGETLACNYADFPNHFGFFLPLAGISTVKQIRDSSFDIRATSRLNRLYVQLLQDNPEWGKAEKRHDMNHFMARLIFCFFAEDTDIFNDKGLFTRNIEQMSARDSSDTDFVIGEIFRAMNIKIADREETALRSWANQFPYVNGGLFSGSLDVPKFSKIARSYLLHIGNLDWTQINPDIFGSMIQAVADDEERGELGMHYTSVPNILKVLNPLFLDDLRAKLEEAGDNKIKLLNLRKRIARIRVFDPACGSGNFLVIAYKQMREIEHTINEKRGEAGRKSEIPLTNFRGIELRDFSAEIARLALIIAEYQCNVRYLGQMEALEEFLPLSAQNWITCGNALRLDWLAVCPPTGTAVKLAADDLFATPLEQSEIGFANEGGETYICGNPPYKGSQGQSNEQKTDLQGIFAHRCKNWKSLDYVAGWFIKAADYARHTPCAAAFVATNSICQGRQVSTLWPMIFSDGLKIVFAHTSFKWSNLASHNAGVTVVIVGISNQPVAVKKLYSIANNPYSGETSHDGSVQRDGTVVREADNINAYLIVGGDIFVSETPHLLSKQLAEMNFGNMANDGGGLIFESIEIQKSNGAIEFSSPFVRKAWGAKEFISGIHRVCLWLDKQNKEIAIQNPWIAKRIEITRLSRLKSSRTTTQKLADASYQFGEVRQTGNEKIIIVPSVSSERRPYLPCGYLDAGAIVIAPNFALYDAPLWNMALIASRLHLVWIATVCGKLETRYRYSNTLGWNTFPVPPLTEQNKADLTECAQNILLAREAHFPATIADLYAPDAMPDNLRAAHERNDEVLERIYIGRRFKNDTERLEKLFEMYAKMTTNPQKRNVRPSEK